MMEKISIIIMLLTFTIYGIYIYMRFPGLKSFSASYYKLEREKKIIFVLFIMVLAFGSFFYAGVSDYKWSWILAASGMFISLVGGNPLFKDKNKMVGTMHYIGAYGGIITAHIYLALQYQAYWANVIFMLLYFAIMYKRDPQDTYWVEVVAFYTILTPILIY